MVHLTSQSVLLIITIIIIFNAGICESKLRIAKCCSGNARIKIRHFNGITLKYCDFLRVKKILNFSEVTVYTEKLEATNKTVDEVFEVVDAAEMNINLNDTEDYSQLIMNYENTSVYLLEDATLHTIGGNQTQYQKLYPHEYCLGYRLTERGKPLSVRFFTNYKESNITLQDIFKIFALLVSCALLSLVLAVYVLLKELRNLRGLVLMSCVASLLVAFLTLAVFNTITMYRLGDRMFCTRFTLPIYYFTLASFFWMNIMSFDIWWTFRGMAMVRAIHRRGELRKYLVYCAYAWGIPLLMTVAVAIIDTADVPDFVKPNIGVHACFFDTHARRFYLHAPMLVLLVGNSVLFLLTVVNMSRLGRDSARLRRDASTQKNRFVLYLKLSAVMGINWLLEVVGSFFPGKVMVVADVYNGLIGVIIFFIFVYKENTIKKLQTRYSCRGSSSKSKRCSDPTDSTIVTSLSQSANEAMPLQGVRSDPRGTTRWT